MDRQLNVSLDEFVQIWGEYVTANVTFEIDYSPSQTLHLDILNILSSQSKSVNIALKATDLLPESFNALIIPPQTKSLSIQTDCMPIHAIRRLIAPIKLRSLTVDFDNSLRDEKGEKVMMILTRDRSGQCFTADWASEPIMSFSMSIWGDMATCNKSETLFEAVVGRAIGRTTWDSRKHLEVITKDLFEKDTNLTRVEIIATYPLYKEELASPKLFTSR
jgi:hypothetical protein